MTNKKNHRYTVNVSSETADMLEEISRLDGTPVAGVIRDCLRNQLAPMLSVSRFVNDPHTTDDGALTLAADMQAMLDRILRGVAGAGSAGVATPPGRPGPRPVTRGPNTPLETP